MIAPELFAYDAQSHCFVRRQPETKSEVNQAVRVAWSGETECIRYRGNDPAILRRFAELGRSHLCDIQLDETVEPLVRNHVSFDLASGNTESATEISESFRSFLLGRWKDLGKQFAGKIRAIRDSATRASFEYAWYADNYYSYEIQRIEQPKAKWLVHHGVNEPGQFLGLSALIQDWLMSDSRFQNVRWYTEQSWNSSQHWTETPW
jgi:hypothetical protein